MFGFENVTIGRINGVAANVTKVLLLGHKIVQFHKMIQSEFDCDNILYPRPQDIFVPRQFTRDPRR